MDKVRYCPNCFYISSVKEEGFRHLIMLFLLSVCISFLAVTSFFGVIFIYNSFSQSNSIYQDSYSPSNESKKVFFVNLTKEQEEYSTSLLGSLNELYTVYNKNIVFTNNLTYSYCPQGCPEDYLELCGKRGCYGVNDNLGTVYISWRNSEGKEFTKREVKNTLAHELLHDFIEVKRSDSKDPNHKVINDLAEKGVVYAN